jgi:hypothetical protein
MDAGRSPGEGGGTGDQHAEGREISTFKETTISVILISQYPLKVKTGAQTRDGATILAAIGLWARIRDDREIRNDGIIPDTTRQ